MTDSTRWFWLTLSAFSFFLLYLLAPILTPFLVAAFLAYLGDPLVDRLEAFKKFSRGFAVTLVFSFISVITLLILLLLIPLLEAQISKLISRLPDYIDLAHQYLITLFPDNSIADTQLFDPDSIKAFVSKYWQEAGGFANNILQIVSRSGLVLLGWLTNLLLIPVVTFYLLRDWDLLVAYIHDLLPRPIEPTVSMLAKESDGMLSAFFRGQLMVMLALGSIYTFGLWLIGLEFALLIGMLAGIVSFVPYLGLIVGILLAGLASLLQIGELMHLFMVFAVFGVAQLIEGVILTPWLVGERIGLHPVTVIFAVLAGGQLFGFFGILLALPVAAVLAVILRHFHQSYKTSRLYQ